MSSLVAVSTEDILIGVISAGNSLQHSPGSFVLVIDLSLEHKQKAGSQVVSYNVHTSKAPLVVCAQGDINGVNLGSLS